MSELQKSLSQFKQKIRSSAVPSQKRVVNSAATPRPLAKENERLSPIKQHQSSLKRSYEEASDSDRSQRSTIQVSGSHLATQMHLAVEFIKSQDRPVSVATLENYLSEGVMRSLLPLLINIDRIRYNAKEKMVEYSSFHNIKSAADLLEYLRSQPTFKGTPVKDLKDGWTGCLDAINELEKQNKIIVSRTKKDNAPRLVWPNLGGDVNGIEDEFVSMWAKIKLPEGDELQIKLTENGLKPTSLDPSKLQKLAPTSEPKKKKPRRGKITNSHLKGILKDYSVM